MPIYIYLKSLPDNKGQFINNNITTGILKTLPYLSILGGFVLLAAVFLPILSYKILLLSKEQAKLISPISERSMAEAKGIISPLVPAVLSAKDEKGRPEIDNEVDYSVISNWFPSAPLPRVKPSKITSYSLSIPKLKIKEAIVTIGGDKIKHSLIHYPGTALPGEYGNTVIFGHSVLPIFYNPKDYKAIFSTIPTLEKGEKINIYFDGIEYIYEVEDYFEVKPEDVQVLEQRFNEQLLSLITCVPPGTYQKRGVIKARLIKI